MPVKNPGEPASQIELALYEKTGANSSKGQYSIMIRKAVEYIRSNQVSLENDESVQQLISNVTN